MKSYHISNAKSSNASLLIPTSEIQQQQSANRSVLEILLPARGTKVSSAALADVNPQYDVEVDELLEMAIPITVRPALPDGRVSVYFRPDVGQAGRRVLREIYQRNRAKGSNENN